MTNDFIAAMTRSTPLSEKRQKMIGKSGQKNLQVKQLTLLQTLLTLIDDKVINILKPESLIKEEKREAYLALTESEKRALDLALVNMCSQMQHIIEFHRSPHTPDESQELEVMIDHLLDMKDRLGKNADLLQW